MEPRRDDGDDGKLPGSVWTIPTAAMEPRRDDGDDERPRVNGTAHPTVPQWSPVVTTGTTARRIRAA